MSDKYRDVPFGSEDNHVRVEDLQFNTLLGAGKPMVDKLFGPNNDSLSADKFLAKLELIAGEDNKIDRKELERFLGKSDQSDRLLRLTDENGDDAISIDEGLKAFAALDDDNDRTLTRTEFNVIGDRRMF